MNTEENTLGVALFIKNLKEGSWITFFLKSDINFDKYEPLTSLNVDGRIL